MKNKKNKLLNHSLLTLLVITFGGVIFIACTNTPPYPQITIPDNVDPEDPNWKGIDLTPKAPIKPLSAAQQKKTFLLPAGYHIDPVLSEPDVQQPGAITFDGNGRMYVLELRSYMLTADSDGQLDPNSGISRWEDKDGDGIYETGGMFVENLVFPRFVLPFGPNSVLTMESNADNVYLYTDTDDDGVADKKEFFTDNFGRSANVEHQQAFLYWGMDNWLYSTVNAFRVRWTPEGVIRETTGSNRAQWGVTQDDYGKLWFQGGASGLPSWFQFPIHYGDYVIENQFEDGFSIPWGAPILIADMQGGMDSVRPKDGSLNRVTGAAGNDVFRGHRLPEDVRGQYFYGEPVARIVRQINPVITEGLTRLENVYQPQKSEFLRSTDPLFRPVDMATAPDGSMYIVDMYHGIIQEGQWIQAGSYLRAKIEQYQLDKIVNLGRVWRITHDDFPRDRIQPRMYQQSSADLLAHFEHINGWWRDMAQQVLVQRQDKSVLPALINMVKNHNNELTRIHALWTLEGLNGLNEALINTLLLDENPNIRIQAMWASETLYKAGKLTLAAQYKKLSFDKDPEVAMRAMMTLRLFKIADTKAVVTKVLANSTHAGVQLVGKQVLSPPVVTGFFARNQPNYNEQEKALIEQGTDIFNGLCSACHGAAGRGASDGGDGLIAPSFHGSPRIAGHPDYIIKTLLHGLTGNIDGKAFGDGVMIPMAANDDQWIAAITSFVRANFENEASLISAEDVARVRLETQHRKGFYQYQELMDSVPQMLVPSEQWKVTASHSKATRIGGTAVPFGVFGFEGWTTGVAQDKGMWFQIELEKAENITEIQFISEPISRGWRKGSPPPLQTYPRDFEVLISTDGIDWSAPVASGHPDFEEVLIRLKNVSTKYLKIVQKAGVNENDEPWSMREMKLFALK